MSFGNSDEISVAYVSRVCHATAVTFNVYLNSDARRVELRNLHESCLRGIIHGLV